MACAKHNGVCVANMTQCITAYKLKRIEANMVQAKANGFTEPDPRDDLAGMDVARKVTILARCVEFVSLCNLSREACYLCVARCVSRVACNV